MPVKKYFNKIPDLLLAQLLSFSFIYALTDSLCLKYPAFNIFILTALCLSLYYIIFFNKLTIRVAAGITTLVLIGAVYFVIFIIGFSKCIEFWDNYFVWLSDYIDSASVSILLFQNITIISLCVLISIFVYIFTIKKFIFIILLTTGITLFVMQWSFNLITSLIPFYIFLFTILLYYLRHILLRKSLHITNEYASSGAFIISILPLCILVVFIVSAIPASSKPIEWKWLDKKINSVYNAINKKLDYEVFDYFSVSSSGFGDKSNILGGRVKLDKTPVLTVETPRNVYLRGSCKDQYTGTKWITDSDKFLSVKNNYSSLFTDTSEMKAGIKLLTNNADFLNNYFYMDNIKITFRNLKTKSIFIPSKIFGFTTNNKINGMVDTNGSFSASKRLDSNFKYSVDLYSPKVGNKEFTDTIKKSRIGLYKDYLSHMIITSDSSSQSSIREEIQKLADNAAVIQSKYLQIPEKLPQRVRDLAASITVPYDNNFDKVKAIEKYLAVNYPYNLDVKSTPKTRDFVDYFLFDMKQGYCTYYASAMAILTRCAGIPARYVEGYILPPKPTEKNSKVYIVTNMQAHAWVEVYFEGYGWLPFEPTSPFRSAFYSDETIQSALGNSYNPVYNDYMEMMKRYGNHNDIGVLNNLNDSEEKNVSQLLIIVITFGILLFIFIAILLFNLFRSNFRYFKMISLPPRESVLALFSYYVSILTQLGLGIEPGETPSQYAKRIDSFFFFSPVKFNTITNIFIKCRYSMNDVSEKEKQLLCDFHRSLASETKENFNKFKYFVLKNILGKI